MYIYMYICIYIYTYDQYSQNNFVLCKKILRTIAGDSIKSHFVEVQLCLGHCFQADFYQLKTGAF